MKKYIAEFIGTFLLVLAGTGAVILAATGGEIGHAGVSLVFGLTVTVVIYTMGDVSGAHINPAVTLGFWAAGRLPGKAVLPYLLAQFAGGAVASLLLWAVAEPTGHSYGATVPAVATHNAVMLEFFMTAILMWVILNVSYGAKEKGIMAGLAIGTTVGLAAYLGGPLTGASMNPARSLGPALASGQFDGLWIYFLAPVAGAIAAVPTCRLVRDKDCCPSC